MGYVLFLTIQEETPSTDPETDPQVMTNLYNPWLLMFCLSSSFGVLVSHMYAWNSYNSNADKEIKNNFILYFDVSNLVFLDGVLFLSRHQWLIRDKGNRVFLIEHFNSCHISILFLLETLQGLICKCCIIWIHLEGTDFLDLF